MLISVRHTHACVVCGVWTAVRGVSSAFWCIFFPAKVVFFLLCQKQCKHTRPMQYASHLPVWARSVARVVVAPACGCHAAAGQPGQEGAEGGGAGGGWHEDAGRRGGAEGVLRLRRPAAADDGHGDVCVPGGGPDGPATGAPGVCNPCLPPSTQMAHKWFMWFQVRFKKKFGICCFCYFFGEIAQSSFAFFWL